MPRPSFAMKALRGLTFALAIAVPLAFHPFEAQAQKPAQSRLSAKDARKAAEIAAKLQSTSTADLLSGLDDARHFPQGAATFVPLVTDLLRKGSSPEVTVAAIHALGALGDRSTSSVLLPYTRHRWPELRVAALEALAQTGGLEAVFTLRKALGDVDPKVRKAAALGLGKLGAKEAIDELMTALQRGVGEAAPAIARIGNAAQIEVLLAKLPALSVPLAVDGSEFVLHREDLSDELKIAWVRRLAERDSDEVRAHLAAFRKRDLSPELAHAIDEALHAEGPRVDEDEEEEP